MSEFREMLPSEKGDAKTAADAKLKALVETRQAMMREDFGRTFQTEHGKRVLAWIAERCGWARPPLAANQQGIIDQQITTHNAMELSFYLAIRKFIHIEVLQQVEYGQVKPSGTIIDNEVVNAKKPKGAKKK